MQNLKMKREIMVRASFAVVVTSESGDNRCVQSES